MKKVIKSNANTHSDTFSLYPRIPCATAVTWNSSPHVINHCSNISADGVCVAVEVGESVRAQRSAVCVGQRVSNTLSPVAHFVPVAEVEGIAVEGGAGGAGAVGHFRRHRQGRDAGPIHDWRSADITGELGLRVRRGV